jgi:hypothetical protein
VIVTDHADIKNSKAFQDAIVERWRGPGHALIPDEW